MTDIAGLLERVRAVTGPDRELDAAIARVCGYGLVQSEWHQNSLEWYAWEGPVRCGPWIVLPKYTASVDAALALVERKLPGWQYHMGTCGEDDMPWACITQPDEPCRDFPASAPTIAIAVLDALLSALSSGDAS